MIEFSYDEEAKACYITVGIGTDLNEGAESIVDKTKVICEDPMVNLDFRKDGSLYGVEILLPTSSR